MLASARVIRGVDLTHIRDERNKTPPEHLEAVLKRLLLIILKRKTIRGRLQVDMSILGRCVSLYLLGDGQQDLWAKRA